MMIIEIKKFIKSHLILIYWSFDLRTIFNFKSSNFDAKFRDKELNNRVKVFLF
jgi:hypothetical protein